MRPRFPRLSRKLLLRPPLLGGAALLVVLVQSRTGSPQEIAAERSLAVRVLPAPAVDLVPRAVGFGTVRPTLSWQAVAEVPGLVMEAHPLYTEGSIVPQGTELLRIDPVDFELAVEEAGSRAEELRAQLEELVLQEINDQDSRQIEERSLALAESDLARNRELAAVHSVSQAVVDEAERRVLAQRTLVQRLRNALRLQPARVRALEARLASQESLIRAANRDLERTRIVAPADLRLTQVSVQAGSYVGRGQTLATGDAIVSVEVPAQFQIDRVRRLLPPGQPIVGAGSGLPAELDVAAVVRLRDADFVVEWEARLARVGASLDPRTRTVSFIVQVDQPYAQARSGTRPPLMRDMFVEVELRGAALPGKIVLPRSALRGDRVWVVDGESRMRSRPVEVAFAQGDLVAVSGGVAAGELVIVSDPVSVFDGSLVAPEVDEELLEALLSEARGSGPGR